MKNNNVIFIRQYKEYYLDLSNYLRFKKIKYLEIILNKSTKIVSIKSKFDHLTSFIHDTWRAVRSISKVKSSEIIISTGYVTLSYLLLRKFRIIKAKTPIIWYGFFLHSNKALTLFKFLFNLFIKKDDKVLVFSKYETKLYSNEMSLRKDLFHSLNLPLRKVGHLAYEFMNVISIEQLPDDFYFSGGYTNRDFLSLIEIFKDLKEKLVICCSSLNKEINNIELPENILLFKDVREDIFNKIIGKSKCVIALMKNNNGASGQMLILEAMAQKKMVIASKTNIIEELILHNKTGFIVENAFKELPEIISLIELNKIDILAIGQNAFNRIKIEYSDENYYKQLDLILQLNNQAIT